MPNKQLVDYVNQCLAQGQKKEQIKQSLLLVGWQSGDIDEVLGNINTVNTNENINPPVNSKKIKKFPFKILIGVISAVIISGIIGGGAYWWYFDNQVRFEVDIPMQENQTTDLLVNEESKISQSEFSCDLEVKKDYIIVSGKVNFPKGIKNPQDYSIIVHPDEYKIFPEGFCAYVEKDRVKLLGAISSKDENDLVLMSIVNSDKDVNDMVIDSFSMAVSMVFMSPFLMNTDPLQADEIISTIKQNQKTIEFSNKIKDKDILSYTDIEEGGSLSQSYIDAIKSVLEDIASKAQ